MSRPGQTRPSPTVRGRHAFRPEKILVLGALGLAFVTALDPFLTMLMLVGMAPAIVAWLTCEPTQRYCAPCIAYLGLSGVLPTLWSFWQADPAMPTLTGFLSDPFVWLTMYVPAAAGLLIYLVLPQLHEALFALRLERRRRLLLRRQRRIIEEWGPSADPLHVEGDRQKADGRAPVS